MLRQQERHIMWDQLSWKASLNFGPRYSAYYLDANFIAAKHHDQTQMSHGKPTHFLGPLKNPIDLLRPLHYIHEQLYNLLFDQSSTEKLLEQKFN